MPWLLCGPDHLQVKKDALPQRPSFVHALHARVNGEVLNAVQSVLSDRDLVDALYGPPTRPGQMFLDGPSHDWFACNVPPGT